MQCIFYSDSQEEAQETEDVTSEFEENEESQEASSKQSQESEQSQLSIFSGTSSDYKVDHIEYKKRRAVNNLLKAADHGPITVLTKPWNTLTEKTQKTYLNKTTEIVESALSVLAPDQEQSVLSDWIKNKTVREELGIVEDIQTDEVLECLMTVYKDSDTWQLKRLILSMVALQFKLKDIQKHAKVSSSQYSDARMHAKMHGPGKPVPDEQNVRLVIDDNSLEHFIEFLFSQTISIDSPFGEKKMKLSSGKELTVPRMILRMHKTHVVNLYIAYCKAGNHKVFSERTYLRIIEVLGNYINKYII